MLVDLDIIPPLRVLKLQRVLHILFPCKIHSIGTLLSGSSYLGVKLSPRHV